MADLWPHHGGEQRDASSPPSFAPAATPRFWRVENWGGVPAATSVPVALCGARGGGREVSARENAEGTGGEPP